MKIPVIIWITIIVLVIAFGGNILSFVGLNPSRESVYFDQSHGGRTYSFNLEWKNDYFGDKPVYEFQNLVLNLSGVHNEFMVIGQSIYTFWSQKTHICYKTNAKTTASTCCGLNGYAANYLDGNPPKCFSNVDVFPDLESLKVNGVVIGLSKYDNSWVSNDFSDSVNLYCKNTLSGDTCLVPVSITNKNLDGSRIDLSIFYSLINIDYPTETVIPQNTNTDVNINTETNNNVVVDSTSQSPLVNQDYTNVNNQNSGAVIQNNTFFDKIKIWFNNLLASLGLR
jgi:hypothetical protein